MLRRQLILAGLIVTMGMATLGVAQEAEPTGKKSFAGIGAGLGRVEDKAEGAETISFGEPRTLDDLSSSPPSSFGTRDG